MVPRRSVIDLDSETALVGSWKRSRLMGLLLLGNPLKAALQVPMSIHLASTMIDPDGQCSRELGRFEQAVRRLQIRFAPRLNCWAQDGRGFPHRQHSPQQELRVRRNWGNAGVFKLNSVINGTTRNGQTSTSWRSRHIVYFYLTFSLGNFRQ